MNATAGQLVFDEYGKPLLILKDQESQKRLTGIDALKVKMTQLPIKGKLMGYYHLSITIFLSTLY